jgi:uncharacterized protein
LSLVEQGISQFNAHDFWHAHESWEQLWLESNGGRREFLQGLIQLAAAYHHVKRGTFRGAIRLFDAALRRLEPFPEGYEGVIRTTACATARIHRERIVKSERIAPDEYPKLSYN